MTTAIDRLWGATDVRGRAAVVIIGIARGATPATQLPIRVPSCPQSSSGHPGGVGLQRKTAMDSLLYCLRCRRRQPNSLSLRYPSWKAAQLSTFINVATAIRKEPVPGDHLLRCQVALLHQTKMLPPLPLRHDPDIPAPESGQASLVSCLRGLLNISPPHPSSLLGVALPNGVPMSGAAFFASVSIALFGSCLRSPHHFLRARATLRMPASSCTMASCTSAITPAACGTITRGRLACSHDPTSASPSSHVHRCSSWRRREPSERGAIWRAVFICRCTCKGPRT